MPERNRLRGAGKHMILIADGDEINIRLLSRHLMGMGEIVACADGAAAVERSLTHRCRGPDLRDRSAGFEARR